MAIQTRYAVGGAGQPYPGFIAKTEAAPSSHPAFNLTRYAVGGSGLQYAGFLAKTPALVGKKTKRFRGLAVNPNKLMRR